MDTRRLVIGMVLGIGMGGGWAHAEPAVHQESGIFGLVSSGRLSGAAVDGSVPEEGAPDESPVRWLERYALEGLSVERTHERMAHLFGVDAGVRVESPVALVR